MVSLSEHQSHSQHTDHNWKSAASKTAVNIGNKTPKRYDRINKSENDVIPSHVSVVVDVAINDGDIPVHSIKADEHIESQNNSGSAYTKYSQTLLLVKQNLKLTPTKKDIDEVITIRFVVALYQRLPQID